ncbi:MAG TPA: PPOX class F420-dependent oxidoreductase [Acidimicrobiales bacterium]|nr:PPOX class F420-dependent oxidoreductase [Acidimicrobiales bacterium]
MLNPDVKALATAPNFAVFTTLLPDGQPMAHVMWVDCDDEHILINTEVHRAKFKNVERDPRVTVTIIDRENGYRFAEVRGEVVETIRGPQARASIDELSQKYAGRPYGDENIQTERVLLKIAPRRQLARG